MVENPSTYQGFEFSIMLPMAIHDVFHIIEPGLQKIQEKARLSWDVMILAQAVERNTATLTMIHRDGKYAGFVISMPKFIGMPNKHYLELSAAYVEPWCHQEGWDGVAATVEWATDFAREMKYSTLLVTGAREGWAKRLRGLGFSFIEASVGREV